MTVIAALTLTGCSSGSPSAGTTSTTTGRTTTTSAGTSTTSASTSTSSPSTTCQATQLAVTPGQSSGAAGQIEQTIVMRNTAATACSLLGYPGMQLYDSSGTAIPTNVVRGMQMFGVAAANAPAANVSLAPGGSASFTLHFGDVPVGGETSCPTSATARITPPNDTGTATVPLQIDPCNGGTVHVSPMYAS